MPYNDNKYDSLSVLTGLTGNVHDLERSWLISITGSSRKTINDLWATKLRQMGFGIVPLDDGWFAMLQGEGYSGTLTDRLNQFWSYGGGIPGSSTLVTVDQSDATEYTPPLDVLNSGGTHFEVTTTVYASDGGSVVIT